MTLDEAVSTLNPFSYGDSQFTVRCREAKPSKALFPEGDTLRLLFPNQGWVDLATQQRTLRTLWIDRPSAKNMNGVAALPLMHLSMSYPSHVKDWQFLRELRVLRYLRLINTTSLRSLDEIGELKGLEILILGGTYRDIKVDTLEPLARLTKLRALVLIAFRPKEWDLRPLYKLRRLEYFLCPHACPRSELAEFEARHPRINLADTILHDEAPPRA